MSYTSAPTDKLQAPRPEETTAEPPPHLIIADTDNVPMDEVPTSSLQKDPPCPPESSFSVSNPKAKDLKNCWRNFGDMVIFIKNTKDCKWIPTTGWHLRRGKGNMYISCIIPFKAGLKTPFIRTFLVKKVNKYQTSRVDRVCMEHAEEAIRNGGSFNVLQVSKGYKEIYEYQETETGNPSICFTISPPTPPSPSSPQAKPFSQFIALKVLCGNKCNTSKDVLLMPARESSELLLMVQVEDIFGRIWAQRHINIWPRASVCARDSSTRPQELPQSYDYMSRQRIKELWIKKYGTNTITPKGNLISAMDVVIQSARRMGISSSVLAQMTQQRMEAQEKIDMNIQS